MSSVASSPPVILRGSEGRLRVAEAVRAALGVGDMVPGQRLVEQDLADEFGVTRNAAREALADLAADDVVELVPHRGARIRVVSVDEAVQITEVRAALERLCARKAAERVTPVQREELRRLGAELRAAVDADDSEQYSALNRRLHDLVIEYSGQEVAARQLDRLNVQTVRFQFRLALRPGRPRASLPFLLAIVDAVADGDPGAADRAAGAQLDDVVAAIRSIGDRG